MRNTPLQAEDSKFEPRDPPPFTESLMPEENFEEWLGLKILSMRNLEAPNGAGEAPHCAESLNHLVRTEGIE